jgi:hypothetical protein
MAMSALDDKREREGTASQELDHERWLAVSEPLPVDDDPEWDNRVLTGSRPR